MQEQLFIPIKGCGEKKRDLFSRSLTDFPIQFSAIATTQNKILITTSIAGPHARMQVNKKASAFLSLLNLYVLIFYLFTIPMNLVCVQDIKTLLVAC